MHEDGAQRTRERIVGQQLIFVEHQLSISAPEPDDALRAALFGPSRAKKDLDEIPT